MVNKKIIVSGDWHGAWGPANTLINKKNPEIILQCGDFGWWPRFHNTRCVSSGEYEIIKEEIIGDPWQRMMTRRIEKKWNQFGVKAKDTKVYFCDGNHEDHWDLVNERNYMKAPCKVMHNVYYMKRGSVLKLPDGRNILFIGGAESIDRDSRTLGVDWFPEESINHSNIENLPDTEIDIVISHTCPVEMYEDITKKSNIYKMIGPSERALSYVLDKYKPNLWYFGHYHLFLKGQIRNTKWFCLNTIGETNWWTYLEEE